MNHQILLLTLTPKRNRIFRRMCRLTSSKASCRDAQPALKNAEQRGLGHFPNKHFATQKVFLYRRKHCLLALRTVKLPFQSSRVIFLGRNTSQKSSIIYVKSVWKRCHMDLPGSTNLIQRKASRTSQLRPIIMWARLFFKLPLQHGGIYGIAVPRFASWYPPSIWKAIWTFRSEKTENSYSNLGILLLCPTWRKSFRKLPHRLSPHGR